MLSCFVKILDLQKNLKKYYLINTNIKGSKIAPKKISRDFQLLFCKILELNLKDFYTVEYVLITCIIFYVKNQIC
jgi:hypothetical protein